MKKKLTKFWGSPFMEMPIWLVVLSPTPLKNDGVKASWDDEIPNIWKTTVYNQHVPKHQPDFMTFSVYV